MSEGLLRSLLGCKANSSKYQSFCASVLGIAASEVGKDVNTYPDAVYLNYKSQGCSFLFSPPQDYKPKYSMTWEALDQSQLILTGIDLYNQPSEMASRRATAANKILFSRCKLPLSLKGGEKQLELVGKTNGRHFIEAFGEPSRKGGENIGIWLVCPFSAAEKSYT